MSSISDIDDSGPSLKELVTKNLETNGILGKLQAQLRASVFLILEEEFKEKNIPLINQTSQKLLSSPIGELAVAVIQDFLQCLSLEFTLAVFCPESQSSLLEKSNNRNNLIHQFGLNTSNTKNGEGYPLLFQLLEKKQNQGRNHTEKNGSLSPDPSRHFPVTLIVQNENAQKKSSVPDPAEPLGTQKNSSVPNPPEPLGTHKNSSVLDPAEPLGTHKKSSASDPAESLGTHKKSSFVPDPAELLETPPKSSSISNPAEPLGTQKTQNVDDKLSDGKDTFPPLSKNMDQTDDADKSSSTTSNSPSKSEDSDQLSFQTSNSSISEKETLSELDREYEEEEFSSLSDVKNFQIEERESEEGKQKPPELLERPKDEEDENTAEDKTEHDDEEIEEDISMDDLMSSNSGISNETKDLTLSKDPISSIDYAESL